MTTWFTSDQHLGHANIIDYCERPFSSVGEMNETIINNWNEVVRPDDDVYVVGDYAMGNVYQNLQYTKRLAGNKLLIAGNHDKCWMGRGSYPKWVPIYEEAGFTILNPIVSLIIGQEPVILCHFPYEGDSHGMVDRFSGNRPGDDGEWLIHGHVHQAWTIKEKQINIGVDVWDFYPVSEDVIRNIMEA